MAQEAEGQREREDERERYGGVIEREGELGEFDDAAHLDRAAVPRRAAPEHGPFVAGSSRPTTTTPWRTATTSTAGKTTSGAPARP
ncbi:hypothetical protein [Streptomyces sp. NBC_00118]|uniref:hypothetical protein n=1 Tax=unclassified Streptomyces TaxID=2593676 RepID=UPI003092AABE|nr:hypothetical protein OG518_33775 [Streptomyces sp. NBC_01397]